MDSALRELHVVIAEHLQASTFSTKNYYFDSVYFDVIMSMATLFKQMINLSTKY